MTFLTVSILEQLWTLRVERKRCTWPSVRAQVESQVLLLRKGILAKLADKIHLMLDAIPTTCDTYLATKGGWQQGLPIGPPKKTGKTNIYMLHVFDSYEKCQEIHQGSGFCPY